MGARFHGNLKSKVLDNMEFLLWSCEDVGNWIASLGFPYYRECFTENLVNGRKLIYVNCVYLPRLGITNFKDMQVISAHVRKLLGITDTPTGSSIAEPSQEPMALFLQIKSRTGAWVDSLTYEQFQKDISQ